VVTSKSLRSSFSGVAIPTYTLSGLRGPFYESELSLVREEEEKKTAEKPVAAEKEKEKAAAAPPRRSARIKAYKVKSG
jgi:hypothetical protein